MARKKSAPEPPPKQTKKPRKIVYEKGNWTVFRDGVGFTKAKIRAIFADDPEGCRGYGTTQEDAEERLHYYENQ